MIPDFFQSSEVVNYFGLWKSIIGLLIVLFAIFIGVEIRIGNEDEETWFFLNTYLQSKKLELHKYFLILKTFYINK